MQQSTRRFLVFGKVQGVFFRQSTRLEAERLGIRGIARNLSDGSVEVLAHGAADALEELRVWLQRGPAHARVEEVRETPAHGADPVPGGFTTI
ncbi:MAG TPA: acylphosphatase [Steroidobacteraceae bacterium]